MTEEELKAIEARANAATPAPWHYDPVWGRARGESISCMTEEDGEFCAHAREDVPKLIAEVERLREDVFDAGALVERKDAEIARLNTRNKAMAGALADLWMRHNGGDAVTPATPCPCSTCQFLASLTGDDSLTPPKGLETGKQ